MKEQIKFKDLEFGPHPAGIGGTRATVEFENGFGASVITGPAFYTSDEEPYELAVTKDGNITYETPITDNVLGYLTADDVEKTLAQIAAL